MKLNNIKNKFKALAVGCGILLGASLTSQAQVIIATNLTAGITNNLLAGNYIIGSIILQSGTIASPQILNFYDSGTTNIGLPITNTWYSRQTITTNIYSVLTNGLGLVYTNVYPGQYTTIVTNNPSTNNLPVLLSMVATSGGTQTETRNSFTGQNITTTKGLTVTLPTGATNVTLTIFASTNGL